MTTVIEPARRASLVSILADHHDQLARHEELVRTLTANGSETANDELGAAMSLVASLRAAVKEVEAALERFDHGTYGTCESCGCAIPAARLEAIPSARLCVSCPRQRSRLGPG